MLKCLNIAKESHPPTITADVSIIDGFYFLHVLKNLPVKYGLLSKHVLHLITKENHFKEVHIIFDQCITPSIKDYERSSRNQELVDRPHVISENSNRPPDFNKELRNPRFKKALIEFFINHWANDEMLPYIGDKKFLLNYDKFYVYQKREDHSGIEKNIDEKFSCPLHEEADTKIMYHIFKTERESRFMIRCTDTDILVIILANLEKVLKTYKNTVIWITSGSDESKFNVNSLYTQLGAPVCKSLPVFLALTGCDYNPAFFKKGRIRPYAILNKSNNNYLQHFESLCEKDPEQILKDKFDSPDFKIIEQFVCEMYGYKKKEKPRRCHCRFCPLRCIFISL